MGGPAVIGWAGSKIFAPHSGGRNLTDPLNLFGNNDQYSLQNPGQIDIHQQNPELAGEVDYLRGKRSTYDAWAEQFTNEGRYRALQQEYGDRAATAASNQYGSLGLAGSAAGLGGAAEARRQSDMAMLNRQLSDRGAINSQDLAFSQPIGQDIGNIQTGFSNYQGMQYNQFMDQQKRDDAQRALFLSLIMKGVNTAAGAAGAGGAGGAAGAAGGAGDMGAMSSLGAPNSAGGGQGSDGIQYANSGYQPASTGGSFFGPSQGSSYDYGQGNASSNYYFPRRA